MSLGRASLAWQATPLKVELDKFQLEWAPMRTQPSVSTQFNVPVSKWRTILSLSRKIWTHSSTLIILVDKPRCRARKVNQLCNPSSYKAGHLDVLPLVMLAWLRWAPNLALGLNRNYVPTTRSSVAVLQNKALWSLMRIRMAVWATVASKCLKKHSKWWIKTAQERSHLVTLQVSMMWLRILTSSPDRNRKPKSSRAS